MPSGQGQREARVGAGRAGQHVMHAGRTWPRLAALSVLRSTLCTVSAPATTHYGAQSHTPRNRCVRGRRRRRLTQHSLPGCLLGITWVGIEVRRAQPEAKAWLCPAWATPRPAVMTEFPFCTLEVLPLG
jgi:hypothetical protein